MTTSPVTVNVLDVQIRPPRTNEIRPGASTPSATFQQLKHGDEMFYWPLWGV